MPKTGVLLERFGIPIFLLLVIVAFAVTPSIGSVFRSDANIQNIIANQSVTGLIALAMIIPLAAGYFDLSVAALAGVSNVTTAALMATYHQPVAVAVAAGILVGILVGCLNAFLVAVIRLDPFITTLGTYIFWSGALTTYTGGQTITNIPLGFSLWSIGKWLGIARPFWILMVVAAVVWFFLTQTPFGRRLAAIGSNEPAARVAGIRVNRAVFITFMLSGLLAGVAGVLLTSTSGGGDSTTAESFLFPALAAVFLGRTTIDPGRYNVWGTMFGLFLIAVAVDGFTLLGASQNATQVFNGLALVLSVAASTLSARRRDRKASAAQLQALRSASG
jgi:ribose transport system permease protein